MKSRSFVKGQSSSYGTSNRATVQMKHNRIGSTFDFCLKDGRIVHGITSGYCHAGADLKQILELIVGLTIRTDDKWDYTALAECFVGILEWSNGIIVVSYDVQQLDM